MSPRRCGSRGERLDGGDARTGAVARVDKRQYETTHFAISLPSEKCGWNVRTKHPFKYLVSFL